ncbi:MAG: helix-turn-helix domain-containing protein [Spirochaetia bacterium]|jgi:two-component system response regulator YesN|nr:helix-turn-helix domain-containing protein [Spirochaetia bacterium]
MKHTVVLVEDEEIELKELEQAFDWAGLGLEVVGTARDGIEGRRLIEQLSPDIVVTDIQLPGQNGLDMVKPFENLRVLIVSGFSDYRYMKEAILIGVEDYLLKPVDDKELEDALRKIIADLADRHVRQIEAIPLKKDVSSYLIREAIAFIDKNYGAQIGLHETATALGISEVHLSRAFKESAGINFLAYLNSYRINMSISLMADPNNRITDIASACGFVSQGYYTKIFKRYIGMTPTKYRENL